MNRLLVLMLAVFAMFAFSNAFAYYNVTFLNTTVILNSTNTNAKVIETLSVFVSNSSLEQYQTSRGAYNLTLSHWQNIIQSQLLTEHIVSPRGGVSNFTFLPGSIVPSTGGGSAILIMSYYVPNVTTVSEIGPRKFEYLFNASVFNFEHTASGQQIPADARLNILVPYSAHIVSIYPLPDYPQITVLGTYANATQFSWYAEEPLSSFSFSYTLTESLQDEVLNYFSSIYTKDRGLLYALIIILIALSVAYIYFKFIANQ